MTDLKGFLIDLDGTLYQGDALIPGAREALAKLEAAGIPYRFVTNTTSKPRHDIVAKLERLGVKSDPAHIFTAPAVARSYLFKHGLKKCYFLLRAPLLADLEGIEVMERDQPQAVVVGDMGDDFTYNKLNRAFRYVQAGAEFITLARNRYFKSEGQLCLDVGAFVAALEYATGREAKLIGKPSPAFFAAALESMGLEPGQAAMVGDDSESDVAGAQACGLTGIQVRTGKFREDMLEQAGITPDVTVASLADVPALAGA